VGLVSTRADRRTNVSRITSQRHARRTLSLPSWLNDHRRFIASRATTATMAAFAPSPASSNVKAASRRVSTAASSTPPCETSWAATTARSAANWQVVRSRAISREEV
jgi:hypothetical protein